MPRLAQGDLVVVTYLVADCSDLVGAVSSEHFTHRTDDLYDLFPVQFMI